MRHLKMLGLAAIAAMALTAFLGASSASATVLCKTTTTPCNSIYNGPLAFSSEGTPTLEGTGGEIEDTCTESTTSGENTNAGGSSATPVWTLLILSFSHCTNTTVVTVEHWIIEFHNISGTDNATVTAFGFRFHIVIFGVNCSYGTGTGIDLGTLTGGNPATMDINAVLPKESGSFLCPGDTILKANYVVTTPAGTTLHVEPS